MKNKDKTKEQLINELAGLRQRIGELEKINEKGRRFEESGGKTLKELKSIFENIPFGIVYLDSEFRIVSSNKFFNDFAGFKEGELNGELCYEIVGEYSDDPTKKGLEKICSFCKKTECFKNKRLTVMERSLGDKIIIVTTIPELNEKGEICGFMEIVEDITERKRAEAEIESLSRFPSENPNPVLRINSEKIVSYKNEALNILLREMGLSEKGIFKILPEDLGILIDKALKTKQPFYLLEVNVGTRVFSYNLIPIIEQNYVNLYGRDITKRKNVEEELLKSHEKLEIRVEERTKELMKTNVLIRHEIDERKVIEKALRESRNELRTMYDAITDMLTVISSDYRILSANRVVEKQYGKDLVGKLCYEVYQGRKEICTDCPTKKAIETMKFAFSFQPGTEVSPPVEIYAYPILNEEGNVIAVVEHGKDITERKKAEEALQRAHNELELRVKDRTLELQEKNIALKVLLKQREEDKNELEQNILSNLKSLIQPYIRKLKRNNSNLEDVSYLNIIESNLEDIISPFSQKLSSKYMSFTSKEIAIANLIKEGKKDKEIMEIMNLAFDTVKGYRKNIRKKLGIHGTETNLRTKLLSM